MLYMECRAKERVEYSRNILEQFILNYISEFSIQKGFTLITAEYIPTKKNIIVKDLYKKLGILTVENIYQLKLNKKLNLETKIKIKDE